MTFSFLISSPMVDLGSFVLLTSTFGSKVAAVYVFLGLFLAVAGGILIEQLHMEHEVEEVGEMKLCREDMISSVTVSVRLSQAGAQMVDTFRSVCPYILLGVAIGAFIHNWIPQNMVEAVLGRDNPLGVILAVAAGVPIYADIFGTIPVAEALLAKGAELGTVIAFMMAVTTLSLPSLIMLRKVVKPRLLTTFIVICTAGMILIGYVFNLFHSVLLI